MATAHHECGGPKSENAKDPNFLKSASPVVKAIEAMLSGKSEGRFYLSYGETSEMLGLVAQKDGSYQISYSKSDRFGIIDSLFDPTPNAVLKTTVGRDGSIQSWAYVGVSASRIERSAKGVENLVKEFHSSMGNCDGNALKAERPKSESQQIQEQLELLRKIRSTLSNPEARTKFDSRLSLIADGLKLHSTANELGSTMDFEKNMAMIAGVNVPYMPDVMKLALLTLKDFTAQYPQGK